MNGIFVPPIGYRLVLLEDWFYNSYPQDKTTVPKGTVLTVFSYNIKRNGCEPFMIFSCKEEELPNRIDATLDEVNRMKAEVKDPLPVKKKGPTDLGNPRVNPERWGIKRLLKEIKPRMSYHHDGRKCECDCPEFIPLLKKRVAENLPDLPDLSMTDQAVLEEILVG